MNILGLKIAMALIGSIAGLSQDNATVAEDPSIMSATRFPYNDEQQGTKKCWTSMGFSLLWTTGT